MRREEKSEECNKYKRRMMKTNEMLDVDTLKNQPLKQCFLFGGPFFLLLHL